MRRDRWVILRRWKLSSRIYIIDGSTVPILAALPVGVVVQTCDDNFTVVILFNILASRASACVGVSHQLLWRWRHARVTNL